MTGKTLRDLVLGKKIDRAPANMTNGLSLFTVSGGRVMVTALIGEVTTVIETKTVNFKLQANPTVGTTTDLCSNLDLSADEVGTKYSIAGNAAATAMQRGESGSVPAQTTAVICAPGTIDAAVGATHTGAIKWTLFYIPIDDGAEIMPAM